MYVKPLGKIYVELGRRTSFSRHSLAALKGLALDSFLGN